MRALVVDDSGIIRSILARVLRGMGVRHIVEAANGHDAWEIYNAQSPDLIITDWHMPQVDGLELTKRIRVVNPHVPVVMVTIVDNKAKVIEAIEAGVTDYLCKPFEREDLEAKLDRFIPA